MNVGIVLAGGFAKGAYQVGALNAIREMLPKEDVKYISCASIGALTDTHTLPTSLKKRRKCGAASAAMKKAFLL